MMINDGLTLGQSPQIYSPKEILKKIKMSRRISYHMRANRYLKVERRS